MPLDATTQDFEAVLFQTRRDQAAALWRTIPESDFDMRNWECGSTACALGWLAASNHDGWMFGPASQRGRLPIAPHGLLGYLGAARYFGLTVDQARRCFGGGFSMARLHRRWFAAFVTPSDVAQSLLAAPYRLIRP